MAGIYLHIPFCKQACYYCDFHFSTSIKKKSDMVAAIKQELISRALSFQHTIKTVYFGGGTPSLLSYEELKSILQVINQHYTIAEDIELTLEANPDDLNAKQLEDFASLGVNRLSIGVQSFFDDDLRWMNRAHTASESINSLKLAKQYFKNITIDLIYGLPQMSTKKWQQNLDLFLDLDIPHLSSYALTVEPKTALDRFINTGKYKALNEELAAQHFEQLNTVLDANGFEAYETSNFAKLNFRSKHNTSYWQGKPYLGVGPSAHSYNQGVRRWNIANNNKYIKALGNNACYFETETLSVNDQYNEYILTGLRTCWGVSLERVEKKFGKQYVQYLLTAAEKFIEKQLLTISDNHLVISKQGKFLADGIAADLFKLDD